MGDDEIERTITAWLERESLADTMEETTHKVDVPVSFAPSDDEVRGIEELKAFVRGSRELASDYDLGPVIGVGGTAFVQVARQRVFGREVAIKRPREEEGSAALAARMLEEAVITGRLQHPNIVPVYDLGFDAQDRPYTVFRRIEGLPLKRLLRDDALLKDRFHADDPLEWKLRVLMQVCHAVHFAHSQGILHRDIKPSNVLIGPFGEVYLADWGIALDTEGGSPAMPVPRSSSRPSIAGTPVYMAPEMLPVGDARVSIRTDVYLLGSTLYEILAGEPPHKRPSAPEVILSITNSKPPPPPGAPPELVEICQKAMDPDPALRHETAEALRTAIEDYLGKRAALLLAREADARLAQLVRLLEAGNADRAELYGRFSECRFGFRQALALRCDSELAREGYRAATEAMAEFELDHGNPGAARTLLAELTDSSPELRRRIDASQTATDREQARLTALDRSLDARVGARSRVVGATVLGLGWTLAPLIGHFRAQAGPIDSHLPAIVSSLAFVAVTLVVGAIARDVIRRTLVNQRLFAIVLVSIIAALSFHAGGALLGTQTVVTTSMQIILSFLACGITAATLEWRLLPASVAYLAAFYVAVTWPDLRYLMVSFGNGFVTLNLVLVWERLHRNAPPPAQPHQ